MDIAYDAFPERHYNLSEVSLLKKEKICVLFFFPHHTHPSLPTCIIKNVDILDLDIHQSEGSSSGFN